jgi:hypothetical protein
LVNEYERTGEVLAELGSDQTSCHNIYNGGYYPVGVTYEHAKAMMVDEPGAFVEAVQKRLEKFVQNLKFKLGSVYAAKSPPSTHFLHAAAYTFGIMAMRFCWSAHVLVPMCKWRAAVQTGSSTRLMCRISWGK